MTISRPIKLTWTGVIGNHHDWTAVPFLEVPGTRADSNLNTTTRYRMELLAKWGKTISHHEARSVRALSEEPLD